MEVIANEKLSLRAVSAGGLNFDFPGYNNGSEVKVHTKAVDGLPVILSISVYHGGEELLGHVSLFLSEVDSPNGIAPILKFTAVRGTDIQLVADQLVDVKFERVKHLGTEWLLSSTGHAAALDGQHEMITVQPDLNEVDWRWERESVALDAFNRATGSFYRLQGMACPTREAAMIQALAAKEKLRGASAALALAIGLTVIS